jgi:hypothetical protein
MSSINITNSNVYIYNNTDENSNDNLVYVYRYINTPSTGPNFVSSTGVNSSFSTGPNFVSSTESNF